MGKPTRCEDAVSAASDETKRKQKEKRRPGWAGRRRWESGRWRVFASPVRCLHDTGPCLLACQPRPAAPVGWTRAAALSLRGVPEGPSGGAEGNNPGCTSTRARWAVEEGDRKSAG